MNLRKAQIILFIIIMIPLVLLSGIRITDFHGRRENNCVLLDWTTIEEYNIKQFNIERTNDIQTENWVVVGNVEAAGESTTQQSYTYQDNNILKSNLSNFYYRLAIVDKNDQITYHDVIVSISINSGIKHTWGSIKSMFR